MHWLDKLSLASISTGIIAIASDATFNDALANFPGSHRVLGVIGIIGVVLSQVARIIGAPSQNDPPQAKP
jgi:hypothetical protein